MASILSCSSSVEAAASFWQRSSSKEKPCRCMEVLHAPGRHGMRLASSKTAWCRYLVCFFPPTAMLYGLHAQLLRIICDSML
eukprot:5748113-Amphidinium_carterae.1